MATMDFQPKHREMARPEDLAASLHANRFDPKLLYASERLAGLWRRVFLAHSPIHRNPEFVRIYEEAFRAMVDATPAKTIWLIGLGAGTGLKEAKLVSRLKTTQREVVFSAVDVSALLVAEATKAAMEKGAEAGKGLVGDLADTEFLQKWLETCEVQAPRLFTFFGLVPNMRPAIVARLFRAILRPGDVLLCSAHLAPVDEVTDLDAAMRRVLPQYDNPETLEWLKVALREWKLIEYLSDPVVVVGEAEGVPAFRGVATWHSEEPFEAGGDVHIQDVGRPLEMLLSRRYTPATFEEFLRCQGFDFEMLAITACREEAIWAVRLRA